MRMYLLMKNQLASKSELEEYFTLDEALKLYALFIMEIDTKAAMQEEMERRNL